MAPFSPADRQVFYSFKWAVRVVEEFTQTYARATIVVARVCDIEPKAFKNALIYAAARSQRRWVVLKNTIKWVEKSGAAEYLLGLRSEDARKYLTNVKYIVEDLVIFEKKSQFPLYKEQWLE